MGRTRGFGRRRGRRLAGIGVVARRSSLTFWRLVERREEGWAFGGGVEGLEDSLW
jgi:hypothetical protein